MVISPALYVPGDLRVIPHTVIPSGWLLCDGSAISRTAYNALFQLLGTLYGDGDGSTTFNLPNFDNYIMQGTTTSSNVGTVTGSATTTLTVDNIPAHTHDLQEHTHTVPAHYHNGPSHTHSIPAHNHSYDNDLATGVGTTSYQVAGNTSGVTVYTSTTLMAGPFTSGADGTEATSTVAATATTTPSVNLTGSTGSGTAFSIQQQAYLMYVIIKY